MQKRLFLRKIYDSDILHALINLKQIVFEVTDGCNLRCKYCGYADLYGGYDKRENKNLSFDKAKKIIDYLAGIWKEHCSNSLVMPLTLGFYGGEPLMNMKLIKQIIDYADSLNLTGKQLFFSMTSNAMLLNKYMDYLADKKFSLLISLDGDEYAQSYRTDHNGVNSFVRVINNINLLREKHPEYFDKHVNFNSVLHNRNSVEGIYYFIRETFGKETTISSLNTSGIRKDKIEEFRKTYMNMLESLNQASDYRQLQKDMFIRNVYTSELLHYIHNSTGNVFDDFNQLFFDKENFPVRLTGTCIPFAKKMFVTVNGKIIQCERINHEFALGSISDKGVELDLKAAADRYNGYIFRFVEQC
ncbi:MAG: radical SAM peptide maturase, partial [Bacteroidales bacterium]|nr:radical SAM peptide maturase [Bacteroidales bacterium]